MPVARKGVFAVFAAILMVAIAALLSLAAPLAAYADGGGWTNNPAAHTLTNSKDVILGEVADDGSKNLTIGDGRGTP